MSNAQIFVVGMHRSGTSAVTNLLANMGAYFGDEQDSIGQNAENPKGFWERRDVRSINDVALHSLGCEWDTLTHWNPDKIPPEIRQTLVQEMASICNKLASSNRSFVIKDPRLCLLMPLWVAQVKNPIVVYVHRSPGEIAASLQSRNGFDLSFGIRLWQSYATHALQAVENIPTIFVDYQNVIDHEIDEAKRIGHFLKLHNAEDIDLTRLHEAEGTLESSLRNQIRERAWGLESDDLVALEDYLYRQCRENITQQDFEVVVPQLSDREESLRSLNKYSQTKRKYDELQLYKLDLKSRYDELQRYKLRLKNKCTELEHNKVKLKARTAHLEDLYAAKKEECRLLTDDRVRLKTQRDELKDALHQERYKLTLMSQVETMFNIMVRMGFLQAVRVAIRPFCFNKKIKKLDLYCSEVVRVFGDRSGQKGNV